MNNSDSDSDDEKNYFAAIDDIDNLGQRDEDDADFESDDEGGFGDGDDLSQLENMLQTMQKVKVYGEALEKHMKSKEDDKGGRKMPVWPHQPTSAPTGAHESEPAPTETRAASPKKNKPAAKKPKKAKHGVGDAKEKGP